MHNKSLYISVCSIDEFKKLTLDAAKRIAKGLPPLEPIHTLFFTSETDLFRTLTPKRMELLRYLRKNSPLSNRQLAIRLNRAYANVYNDVQSLLRLGLIKKNKEQKLTVPWDELKISVPLAA